MNGGMTKNQKLLLWLLIFPSMSIVHYAGAMALLALFLGWGEDVAGPPSVWITAPCEIAFRVMAPFCILVGYLDKHVIRLRDYWYYVSIIVSAVLWWIVISWLVTHRLFQRTR